MRVALHQGSEKMLAALFLFGLASLGPIPSELDAAVDAAAAKGLAGEVLVTNAERVTYARAISAPGRRHRRGEIWRWASVTKQLTATLALQAIDEGKLSLDDTLAERLPAFSRANAKRITIRMLLKHTTGLPNPDDTPQVSPSELPDFYRRTSIGAGGQADALGFCAGAPETVLEHQRLNPVPASATTTATSLF